MTALDAASQARFSEQMRRHRAAAGIVIAATHEPLDLPDAQLLQLRH
jgi:heme exporter protein A